MLVAAYKNPHQAGWKAIARNLIMKARTPIMASPSKVILSVMEYSFQDGFFAILKVVSADLKKLDMPTPFQRSRDLFNPTSQKIGEQRCLGVHPVLGLVVNHGLWPIGYFGCDFFAEVHGHAVHELGRWLGP